MQKKILLLLPIASDCIMVPIKQVHVFT